MNELFVSLYLDEDVSVLVATLVQARGFSALTTLAASQIGQIDAAQLAFATRQRRALLTHNRADFEQLAAAYFAEHRPHHGIIIAVRRSPYEIAGRLLRLMNDVSADEMVNQVWYI